VSELTLNSVRLCFEGAVPAVIATAATDGTPNITYLSRVQAVDDERVALSNQFFSKTARNLAENPRASVLLVDPTTFDEFRLSLVYERTERRGPVFERLRRDIDALAAMEGMPPDVFKLRAADIYRVVELEPVIRAATPSPTADEVVDDATAAQLAELVGRLSRCADLDTLVGTTVDGLADLFGFEHSLLLLLDEDGKRLYTIASHGFDAEGVGSEVAVGEGIVGMAAARATPLRLGNLRQMAKYSRTVRRSYEEAAGPGQEIPMPALGRVQSRVAVPAMVLGQVVGVLTVESDQVVAFTAADEAVLSVVAALVGQAIELERGQERAAASAEPARAGSPEPEPVAGGPAAHVRFYAADGSTFLDGDYLIKGVAGRLLWSLVVQHEADGRVDFTNREVRLDPSLELPPHKDNFESRLILLKRRLDERAAPVRIEKTGRGRFRLVVDRPLRLEAAGDQPSPGDPP
jgi:predicted pyridoxine 5'-phosphate oxidase superfamily flavin-nucleotide-binding protein